MPTGGQLAAPIATRAQNPASKGHPVAVIAQVLGIGARRVQQLARQGVLPRAGRGRYQLTACVQAYIKYWQDRAEGRSTNGGGDIVHQLREQKHRILVVEAEQRERALARERGETVTVGDMEDMLRQVLDVVQSQIQALPGKLAPQLVGVKRRRDVRTILDTGLADVLRAFSANGHRD